MRPKDLPIPPRIAWMMEQPKTHIHPHPPSGAAEVLAQLEEEGRSVDFSPLSPLRETSPLSSSSSSPSDGMTASGLRSQAECHELRVVVRFRSAATFAAGGVGVGVVINLEFSLKLLVTLGSGSPTHELAGRSFIFLISTRFRGASCNNHNSGNSINVAKRSQS